MSLEALTFETSVYFTTGLTAPTDAQIIDVLIAQSATYLPAGWRVISSVASTYIEYGGPVGEAGENIRVIVGINPTTAFLAPDSSANAIWIGWTYDCKGQSIGTWNSTTPYGGTVDFMGYTKSCPSGVAENIRFICSEESFQIVFRDDSFDRRYGTLLGAIIDPLTGSAMPDGRVYAMFTTGVTLIDSSFWQYAGIMNQWMTHGGANGNNHAYCFRPTAPANIDIIARQQAVYTSVTNQLTFLNNDEALPVVNYYADGTPKYQVGVLRQIHPIQDRTDATPVSAGIVLAKSNTTPYDAMLFRNV